MGHTMIVQHCLILAEHARSLLSKKKKKKRRAFAWVPDSVWCLERKHKGSFAKGWFCQMCPRSSFWYCCSVLLHLVSHYSATGDTISCDVPYSAIGFRGEPFLRYPPPLQGLSLDCDRPFYRKKRGCSSDSLRYHRKHSATGVFAESVSR